LEAGKLTTKPKEETLTKLAKGLDVYINELRVAAGMMPNGGTFLKLRAGDIRREPASLGTSAAVFASNPELNAALREAIDNATRWLGEVGPESPLYAEWKPVVDASRKLEAVIETIQVGDATSKTRPVPVHVIAAGKPLPPDFAQADRMEWIPASLAKGAEAIFIADDSGVPGLSPGDWVFVKHQAGKPTSGQSVLTQDAGRIECVVYRSDEVGEYFEAASTTGQSSRKPVRPETEIIAAVIGVYSEG
jgi:hypothetical protein